jgi:ABC-2 type transport system ATP-binding protein
MINISPQETAVAPNLTVRENLELAAGIYGMDRETSREKRNRC